MFGSTLRRWLVLSIALLITSSPVRAHEVRPTIADVSVTETEVTLSLRLALEALIAGIDLATIADTNDAPEAVVYDRLRALDPAALEAALRDAWPRLRSGFLIEVAGETLVPEIRSVVVPVPGDVELPRDSILSIAATLPPGEAGVAVGLAPEFGTFVPRQIGAGDGAYEGFLSGGALTPPLPRIAAGPQGFAPALVAGVQQILPLGLPHILVVLGIFFHSAQVRPVIWQMAALLVGYSASLALAAWGLIAMAPGLVATLVAASVIAVGADTFVARGGALWRGALILAVGLVHGLAFAQGLGSADGPALLGYDLGLALGLLAVLAVAFAVFGWAWARDWFRRSLSLPASALIVAVGAYMVVERNFF